MKKIKVEVKNGFLMIEVENLGSGMAIEFIL
jgi:hypothetical protein